MSRDGHSGLLVRVVRRLYVLPLDGIVEIMRPLPVAPLAGVPTYVQGMAVLRGEATPVLDLAALLEGEPAHVPGRFVLARAGTRRVALAVTDVHGVRRDLPATHALPPLARGAAAALEGVGALDQQLMLVLAAARLAPDLPWSLLGVRGEEGR